MSDQKSASRRAQVGRMLANRAGPQQSRGMPMFGYQPVRVVRALLVTLACLVVALASGLPQASADSAQQHQRCHHASTACRHERASAEHAARKAQQTARKAADQAAKAAAKTVDREPRRTTTPVVTPPPQHPGTVTAPPSRSTSTPSSTATVSPTGHPAAPSAAAPFAAAPLPVAPLPVAPFTVGSVNPAPPSRSTLPETATRTVSVRSSTPGTRSKSTAFAAPFDAPGSKSLLGIDDSPLLGAILALLALAVTVMVASAGRRGRRTH